jgi:hypothetical protein
MSVWILILIMKGTPAEVAIFPHAETCAIIADAMNTHPNKGDNAYFVCQEQTNI